MRIFTVLLLAMLITSSCADNNNNINKNENHKSHFVDPFIGTGGHGHTYPGASEPFGMLQVSPVNGMNGWDWSSGYHYSDSLVIGFSHLNLSGTGIGDLNDILFMPSNQNYDHFMNASTRDGLIYKSYYEHEDESASPGYYQVFLKDSDINVELATTNRVAYHKYSFKEGDNQSVIINLGFSINWDEAIETSIKIENNYTVSGYRYSKGWAKNQKVYFVASFSKPIINSKQYNDGNLTKKDSVKGVKTTMQLMFDHENSNILQAKVALSSVSVYNAKKNLDQNTFTFDTAKKAVSSKWNNALSSIKVETPIDSLKTIFYTALYHTQLAPVTFSDENGDFRLENDSVIQAKDYTAYSTLSLWDTFRAEHPLLTLIEPNRVNDIINSMLAYYDVDNILPVWTLYGNETNTMTGYHSIPVIVEAYKKGIRGFDAEKAYQAMKTTMMQNDRGLDRYKTYGYIPYTLEDESVTISLEYAYNDWCVALMAKALGKTEDYRYFLKRSEAYQYLFDQETGFMRGKSEDGQSWNTPFDPKYSNHRQQTDYTEGNAWQHSWFVPHDVNNLIKLHGGNQNFSNKLERLFTESSEINGDNTSADISGLIGQYAHGNEPSHHIAYLFNYAKRPWRTQFWVRQILKSQYNSTPNGLSGNEDCGQMSAWYVLSSIGLYPVNPASGVYEIGSPLFEKTTIELSDDKNFIIEAENVSDKNLYIQSAKLNGKAFNKTTISHQDISNGGKLYLKMGNKPNKDWGIKINE